MSDLNNYFETLERSLKRISIVLIDDFEEIKKGNPIPIIALMRKILFSTSTIVMKHMLLRGCPSHTPDRKFVISVFDLLRETIKHQPAITLDQFFALVITLINFLCIFILIYNSFYRVLHNIKLLFYRKFQIMFCIQIELS